MSDLDIRLTRWACITSDAAFEGFSSASVQLSHTTHSSSRVFLPCLCGCVLDQYPAHRQASYTASRSPGLISSDQSFGYEPIGSCSSDRTRVEDRRLLCCRKILDEYQDRAASPPVVILALRFSFMLHVMETPDCIEVLWPQRMERSGS